jgi:hypothetical protein
MNYAAVIDKPVKFTAWFHDGISRANRRFCPMRRDQEFVAAEGEVSYTVGHNGATASFSVVSRFDAPIVTACYVAEAIVEGLKARRIEPHVAIKGTVTKNGKARNTAVPPERAASLRYCDQPAAAQMSAGLRNSRFRKGLAITPPHASTKSCPGAGVPLVPPQRKLPPWR